MLFVNRKNNKGNNQSVGYRRSLVMKTKVLTRVTMMVALMIVSGVLTIPLPGFPVPIVLQPEFPEFITREGQRLTPRIIPSASS